MDTVTLGAREVDGEWQIWMMERGEFTELLFTFPPGMRLEDGSVAIRVFLDLYVRGASWHNRLI